MDRTLGSLLTKHHFKEHRMAIVVGPRQVGKTTLARHLLDQRHCADLYRSWDDLEWRRSFARAPYAFVDDFRAAARGRPLVVLDELHKHPRWKNYLKGLWDTRGDRIDLLVTGSGRLDLYQRGGDSLLGRYHQYRLYPLSLKEVLAPNATTLAYRPEQTLAAWRDAVRPPAKQARQALADLLRWGGFPEPFIRQQARHHRLWLRERRDLIVRQDLRDLTHIQLLAHVEQLVELIAARSGSPLSYNNLREDLQVATDSVKLWVEALGRLYFLYVVRPYAGRLARALRREPKVYLWDWSEVPEPGPRFENLIATHLLKWCHFTHDWGLPELDLYYLRDKEKREVDFLITRERKPWLLVEAKVGDTRPGPALDYFGQRLDVPHRLQVVLDLPGPGRAGDTLVLDAATFLQALPV